MADEPKEPKTAEPKTPELKDAIKEVLQELGITKAAEPKTPTPAAPGDISAQVQEAVRTVREGDAAARERAKLEERLAAVEAKQAEEPEEKAPKEYRRLTTLLWGGDDDE